MIIDLHCHSYYSDGSCSLEQIADFAKRKNITHLALTDHDTMKGVEKLIPIAASRGITVVPGAECTCTDEKRGRSVHMLCYLPREPQILTDFFKPTLERRRIAKLDMAKKIGKLYPITQEDVLYASRHSVSIHEPHVIQPLADMGYTNTVLGPFMDSLIGKKGSCYTPIQYPDVYDALAHMRKAGGVTVLAHPGQFQSMELAEDLCREGLLDGIEAFHPRNSADITQQCKELAKKYDLVITGGSDFHGYYAKKPSPLGTCFTPPEQLERLYACANS